MYLQVRESLVLPVEIHVLETQSGQNYWFEEKHLQVTTAFEDLSHIMRKPVFRGLRQGQTQTSLLSYKG